MIEDTLVFMRTHVITKGVLSEFLKLKKSICQFGENMLQWSHETEYSNNCCY